MGAQCQAGRASHQLGDCGNPATPAFPSLYGVDAREGAKRNFEPTPQLLAQPGAPTMRNILLTSTAAVCLMLTATAANAQSDAKKQDEIKKEHVQQPSGAVHQQQQAQEPRQQRPSTTGQASEQKNEDTKKSEGETRQNKPGGSNAGVSEKKDQDVGKNPSNEKSHSTEKSEHERSKSAAEQQKASPSKSTVSEENKTGRSEKPSTAESPKSGQKQENASTPSSNINATNKGANEKPAATNTTAPNNSTNATNTSNNNNPNTPNRNASTNSVQIDAQKKAQISESISRTHDLAPPVRDLNISITVGQRVPSHVHLRPLPREIVTIAPEYRDYDYFTTEEEVVIVSPRTHEIVTEIPRDASRARAQVGSSGGYSSTTTTMTKNGASNGPMPCQVMQRMGSGDLQPMDLSQLRQTTGSGGEQNHLSVRVQGPNGQQMPEVTLPDQQGRIVAETNGSDCRIIVESGPTPR
jgi:hypothetical protein